MQIFELKTAAEFAAIFPLVRQLNPTLDQKRFGKLLKAMREQGYRCIAARHQGKYIGACGFWRGTRFWCGDFIDLDNVVVDKNQRGKKIGQRLVAWVEKEAKKQGCEMVGLDCYTTSVDAQRFYCREGYIIKGFHFIKPL